jgi:hypothetical protein
MLSEEHIQNQIFRIISTGKLNTLLHLHIRPINLVVYQDPLDPINRVSEILSWEELGA